MRINELPARERRDSGFGIRTLLRGLRPVSTDYTTSFVSDEESELSTVRIVVTFVLLVGLATAKVLLIKAASMPASLPSLSNASTISPPSPSPLSSMLPSQVPAAASSSIPGSPVPTAVALPDGSGCGKSDRAHPELKYSFEPAATVFLSEVVKFVFSVAMATGASACGTNESDERPTLRSMMLYSVPALLYFLSSNLDFVSIRELDPPTIQLLGSTRILVSALLSHYILRVQLQRVQVVGILILFSGVTVAELRKVLLGDHCLGHFSLLGVCTILTSSMLTSVSAVLCSKLLARSKDSPIHLQNSQLYLAGMLFNGLLVYFGPGSANIREHGLTYGFTTVVWLIIAANSGMGICVSIAFKYTGVMPEVFAGILTTLLISLGSALLFHFKITFNFVLGAVLVFTGLSLYYLRPRLWLLSASAPESSQYAQIDADIPDLVASDSDAVDQQGNYM
eukprot:comp17756_c0_seq1/m.30556 comp17756_c0_seq1/g.30556  ORF comp17756_c0_seq1/g.30556 comp17756_c0_seq1/m.30556 type:complete len:453 (+) comp17756_c0_seq1:69-1427(+)